MTIQKIARLARVSIATVSRTINRVPTVDPVLAQRVWRVIEKQGYYPNRHARSLVSGRSRIFALMVPEAPNAFFPEIIQTFARLCIQHNYQALLSAICQDARLLETAARQMIERRFDGVAILTFREQKSLVEIFRDRNVSVFVIDSDRPGPLLRSVCIDYQHGILQAVQHLAALGHNRIAFVSGPAHSKTAAPDRPTAVVCSNDLTAIGVIRKAFDLSLDIHGDLSVVGIDDIPFAQYMIPPLSTVQIPQKEIATLAFGALRDAAESATGPDQRAVSSIATYLVVRSSNGMAPDRLRDARRSPSRGAYGQANRYI